MKQIFQAKDLESKEFVEIGYFLNYKELSDYAACYWKKAYNKDIYMITVEDIDILMDEIYKDIVLIHSFPKHLQEDDNWSNDVIFSSKFFALNQSDTYMRTAKLLYLYGLLSYLKYKIEYLGSYSLISYIEEN